MVLELLHVFQNQIKSLLSLQGPKFFCGIYKIQTQTGSFRKGFETFGNINRSICFIPKKGANWREHGNKLDQTLEVEWSCNICI